MSEESVEFFCHIFLNLISPNTKKAAIRRSKDFILFYFSLTLFPQTIFIISSGVLNSRNIGTNLFNPINIHKVRATLDVFILWLRSHRSLIWEDDLVQTRSFFSWILQPEISLKVGRSLRWRDEGEHEENPRTKVQVYIDLLKMSFPLALYSTPPLPTLSPSLWMVFFVFSQ